MEAKLAAQAMSKGAGPVSVGIYKILVTGDRNWTSREVIARALEDVRGISANLGIRVRLVHGGARGADSIADDVGRELGFEIAEYPAKWWRYGRAAGPVRNAEMVSKEKPNVVLAFHDDLSRSKGTKHMVGLARSRAVPVFLWDSKGKTVKID